MNMSQFGLKYRKMLELFWLSGNIDYFYFFADCKRKFTLRTETVI